MSTNCENKGDLPIDQQYTFDKAEQTRLEIYRAAVAAGFYTDDGEGEEIDITSLQPVISPRLAGIYAFTGSEEKSLEVCKAAVIAGYYSDQLSAPAEDGSTDLDPTLPNPDLGAETWSIPGNPTLDESFGC